MMKKIIAIAVAVISIFVLFPNISHAESYVLYDGTYYMDEMGLNEGDSISVQGTVTLCGWQEQYYYISITCGDGAHITLDGVWINNEGSDESVLTFNGAGTLATGSLGAYLRTSGSHPCIEVGQYAYLTITGSGQLDAFSEGSAAIGGGEYGETCGTIDIRDAKISATASAEAGGAGIGGGYNANSGPIYISGNSVINAQGGYGSAGIGGGPGGDCGTVTISGGEVTAYGDNGGAGIGGGRMEYGTGGNCGAVTISGGSVKAYGGDNATGIGGGTGGSLSSIAITGGIVEATGSGSGFDIGGASGGSGGTLSADRYAAIRLRENGTDSELSLNTCLISGTGAGANAGAYYNGSKMSGTVIDMGDSGLASGSGYTFNGTTAAITTDGSYIIAGTANNRGVLVGSGVSANVALFAASLTYNSGIPFKISGGSADIALYGDSELKSTSSTALECPAGSSVEISGEGGLTVTGGNAGIGGGSDIPEAGNITISGGTITVKHTGDGACIGGGNGGNGGTIRIEGGTVSTSEVTSGTTNGAGLGGGMGGTGGSITITGGDITARGGAAGIGGGTNGNGGNIQISGGDVDAYGGSAGIGGGYSASGGEITISGGNIQAHGGNDAPGIGCGAHCANSGTIAISGGSVGAYGGIGGAGIGAGYGETYYTDAGTLTVTGGGVLACGGARAAGIGGGERGTAGTIDIQGGTVRAEYSDENSGAGIGGGESGGGGIISISGGKVFAFSGSTSAGIGGGEGGDGGNVSISGGAVFASCDGEMALDIGPGHLGGEGVFSLSGTAAVFLMHNTCTIPDTLTHELNVIPDLTDGGVYGIRYGTGPLDIFDSPMPLYIYLNPEDLFTLTYDINGGEGTLPDAVTQYFGTTAVAADGSGLNKGGYPFSEWADLSNNSYEPGDTITFTEALELFAKYQEPATYTITAAANSAYYGSVSGSGIYEENASVTLAATPNAGCRFVRWIKNGAEVPGNQSITFSATENAGYTAEFAPYTPLAVSCAKTDNSVYGGASGSVTVSASGGDTGSYEYSINGGSSWQSANVFSGLAAGTYTAAIRDAGYPNNTAVQSVVIGQPTYMGVIPAKKLSSKAKAGTAITITPPAAPKGYTIVSITYSSTNPSVATVDANGNITFLAGGKAKIITKVVAQMTDSKGRVKTKTTTVKKTVTVKQPVASISLNLINTTIVRKAKVKLATTIAPATASSKKVKWASSNKKVATVSSSGVVTGKGVGTAIITCTAKDGSGVAASCTVTVTPIYPAGVKISRATTTVKAGKTATLKAKITPKDTDFKTVVWQSSNPAVATVDAKGKVRGIAPGIAIITATTSNGIIAMCTVTVK